MFPIFLLRMVLVSVYLQDLVRTGVHMGRRSLTSHSVHSIPETKGLSLEKMDDLFGTTELKKKMDDQEGAHDVPPAKDPEDEKTQHVEVSPVPNDSKR